MQNTKELIKSLLSGNINVKEDDNVTAIPVLVHDGWFDKSLFKNYGVLVTVGPDLSTNPRIMDIGAHNREYIQSMQVDVWVLDKQGVNYSPERVKWDTQQEIDRLVFAKLVDPSSEVKYIFLSNWRDRDEPGAEVMRSTSIVTVMYFKKA